MSEWKMNFLGDEVGTERVPKPPPLPDRPMTSHPEDISLWRWHELWNETREESLRRGERILALMKRRSLTG